MKDFYSLRLAAHQKKLLKYLKYVFNDHLVLASTFILGGLGLYYSDFVKTLTPDFKIGYLIIWALLLASLHVGRLATLVEPADKTFLLPKEQEMTTYLKASFKHSLVFPLFVVTLVIFCLLPLLMAIKSQLSLPQMVAILLTVILLKVSHLFLLKQRPYVTAQGRTQPNYLIWLIVASGILAAALYLPYVAVLLSLLTVMVTYRQGKAVEETDYIDWDILVATETQRLKRIYRFINLFTDVPNITPTVKRRKFLDPLLTHIKPKQGNTFDYLYTRHFLRGSDFGSLVFRLTVIGSLVLLFVHNSLLAGALALLILFLIGFQLLPLSHTFDYVTSTQLYPLPKKANEGALSRLIIKVLLSVTMIFSIIALIIFPNKLEALVLIGLLLIETLLFTKAYLPQRLRKMAKF